MGVDFAGELKQVKTFFAMIVGVINQFRNRSSGQVEFLGDW